MEVTPKDIEMMVKELPICFDWVNFNGQDVVAQLNYEETLKAGKLMVDISYCMTKAYNQLIDETVEWDQDKFNPSELGGTW